MSNDQGSPNEPGPPAPAPSPWNPAVTFLMILLGFPLLLPGVCSFLFARAGGGGGLEALGFLIAFGGIAMIVAGIRRLRKNATTSEPTVSENAKLSFLIVLLVIFVLLGLLAVPLFKL